MVASPGAYDGVGDEPAEEGEVRRDPSHLRLGERGCEEVEGFVPVAAVRHQLRDHRVVREPDLVALLDARVDAHRHPCASCTWEHEALDSSRLREEGPGSSA